MENSGTQTVATFTGTLLKRRRSPGQPFAQLVFREANQDWLCLTSNLQHAARLQIGKKYQIEGLFKSLGDHDYIHEPNIMPLARQIRKRRIWISLAIGLVILLTAGGIVLAATHDNSPPKQPSDTSATQQTPVNDTSNTSDTPPTDTTDTTTTDTPATTPVTAPITKTTKTNTNNNSNTGTPPADNSSNNSQGTPPPPPEDCDAAVQDVSFQTTYQYIPDQPDGTLVTAGVLGWEQTCYPNGRGQPVQTVPTQAPTDEVLTTTTPPNP